MSNVHAVDGIESLGVLDAGPRSVRAAPAPPHGEPPAADKADLSPWGDVLSRLHELAQSDPTRYAEVMGRAADAARVAEPQARGDPSHAAETFATAARTGQLPVFHHAAAPVLFHAHHGHRPHALPAQPTGALAGALASLRADLDPPVGTARPQTS